jgi:hypothetical protein
MEGIYAQIVESREPKTAIDKLFTYVKNRAKGNCLFESFAQHFLEEYVARCKTVDTAAAEIRKNVCEFYKEFDETEEYDEGTIENNIAMMVRYDNDDEDGGFHTDNICNDSEWASLGDIYVICKLYYCNVILLKNDEDHYRIVPILIPSATNTYVIRHVNGNHYEACIPKETTANANTTRKRSPPKHRNTKKAKPSTFEKAKPSLHKKSKRTKPKNK